MTPIARARQSVGSFAGGFFAAGLIAAPGAAQLPQWPETWVHFAEWPSLTFMGASIPLILLIAIWWRQQTRGWFRIVAGTFLAALILTILSTYLFVIPPHTVGCIGVCQGQAGFPLAVALLGLNGGRSIAPLDFLANFFLLWLLWMGATLLWALLGTGFQWWRRSWRLRVVFVLVVVFLPWAYLPRVLDPPEPQPVGEELRLANNALRAAEFTYGITGVWVQRLALEDMRPLAPGELTTETRSEVLENRGVTEVCLRGYTYFYLPWRRYRITLDASGATALSLVTLPLDGPCLSQDNIPEE